jgi:uncharacterized protein (DUF1778 family)
MATAKTGLKVSLNRYSSISGAESSNRASCGRTVSEFVLTHAEFTAKKVIDEHEKLHLDQAQSRILVDALLAPRSQTGN